jgi:hypothetical protein
MQSLLLLEIITPFFQRILCSCSQAFWSCLRWKILVVIEGTYASRSNVMITGLSSSTQWLLVVVQSCDKRIELGPDYIGGVGKVQTSAAWALQRPLSWRRRTPLECTRQRFLLTFSNKLHVFTLFDHKKRITARCPRAVQFESGVVTLVNKHHTD